MVLIDTNILVFAHNADSPYSKKATKTIRLVYYKRVFRNRDTDLHRYSQIMEDRAFSKFNRDLKSVNISVDPVSVWNGINLCLNRDFRGGNDYF